MFASIEMGLLSESDVQDKPKQFKCNKTSPCKVMPMDSLFAILDCDPEGLLSKASLFYFCC